ncbi:hypothetical protein V8G54_013079 [Vigna mungo]|uniref:Uncharacterized protein n=1 Tax=Vigna mungo TaxID=3915 RepID=A0AAQ3S3Z3_VIGMU
MKNLHENLRDSETFEKLLLLFLFQVVVDVNVVPFLVELLYIADFEVKKSAAWVIGNVFGRRTKENVMYGCIKGLCELLVSPDPKLVLLEGLKNFLKMEKDDQDNVFVAKGLENFLKMEKDDHGEDNVFVPKGLENFLNMEKDDQSEDNVFVAKGLENFLKMEKDD